MASSFGIGRGPLLTLLIMLVLCQVLQGRIGVGLMVALQLLPKLGAESPLQLQLPDRALTRAGHQGCAWYLVVQLRVELLQLCQGRLV